jgi:hypothetical protein
MQLVIENDPDNELYRIGEGGDGDKDGRIQGPIALWGEVAELQTEDGAILRALVTEEGELIPVGGVTFEFDAEEWDLEEAYDEQDREADEPEPLR